MTERSSTAGAAPLTQARHPNYQFACAECGRHVEKYVRPSYDRPRFCGKSCAIKASHRDPETRAKRLREGPAHYRWQGEAVSEKGGRKRALKAYAAGPCQRCGGVKGERHHEDGNTANNAPDNIKLLCRRCHMVTDGRLEATRARMAAVQPMGVAARWPR